ncbi:glycosyltransferase family 2 protein [Paenibacillus physcomitrellae]|uniref:LPS biosynthesis protein n=1 Tax=Paenibacillus physcomitrellae TaxID=1619311 RepID=A0ABQ1FRD9_9BACL|nr:glycosyltransferase family 2 protein [Paenibacillus physcomitrellae]GGA26749.1 LPS biosynthesis protein [Paenibacillus physcomitrellae]
MHPKTVGSKENRISVVIIAQNDEQRIPDAVASCRSFADEIVVVDGGSEDGTVATAEALGCRVYENAWPGYAKQRQFGENQASYDWIFVIDTDEVVDTKLAAALIKLKPELTDPTAAYSVYRIGDFLGRWLDKGEYLVRLYNRRAYKISDSLVHEMPDVETSKIIKLNGVLWHYGFRSINDHVNRFNKYTDLEAQTALRVRKPFRIVNLLFRPPARFVQKYFLHGLYRKGVAGFAVAIFWMMYEFLACFKHYELTSARKRLDQHQPSSARKAADPEKKGETSYAVQ